MAVALAHILHRWVHLRRPSIPQETSTSSAAPRATPRLVVRSAGILTAFLCQELKSLAFGTSFLRTSCGDDDDDDIGQSSASWIR